MDYTITVTDTQKKSLEYISPDVDEWITNAATNRARQAKDEIIDKLVKHCNSNSITIATGEAAQVDQAYSLKVVTKAVKVGAPG
jgi:hypothetical protein